MEKFRKLCRVPGLILIILTLVVLLGSQYIRRSAPNSGSSGTTAGQAVALIELKEHQWVLTILTGLYFLGFSGLRRYGHDSSVARGLGRYKGSMLANWPEILLIVLLGLALTEYGRNYHTAYVRADFITLFAGVTLARGMVVLDSWRKDTSFARFSPSTILTSVVLLLAVVSLCHPDMGTRFLYRDHVRWTGPYVNPNTFGLLMAVGVVLCVGGAANYLISGRQQMDAEGNDASKQFFSAAKSLKATLCIIILSLLILGLIKSFSRGAWLASFCGLFYLTFYMFRSAMVWNLWKKLAVIGVSSFVIIFWQFQHAEHGLIRRAFSAGNINEFSARNRLSAWQGTLQMMADKPWSGFGWNRPEQIYDDCYRVGRVMEGMAIRMNDYFLLGTTLGLPALGCFLAFAWYLLSEPARRDRGLGLEAPSRHEPPRTTCSAVSELVRKDYLRHVCSAGAIVLLVGFWFVGGLFDFATGALLWILLELTSAEKTPQSGANHLPG